MAGNSAPDPLVLERATSTAHGSLAIDLLTRAQGPEKNELHPSWKTVATHWSVKEPGRSQAWGAWLLDRLDPQPQPEALLNALDYWMREDPEPFSGGREFRAGEGEVTGGSKELLQKDVLKDEAEQNL